MVRGISPDGGITPTSPAGNNGPSPQEINNLLSMKQSLDNIRDTINRGGSKNPALNQLVAELDPIEKKIDGLIDGSIPWSRGSFFEVQLAGLHQTGLIIKEQQKEIEEQQKEIDK